MVNNGVRASRLNLKRESYGFHGLGVIHALVASRETKTKQNTKQTNKPKKKKRKRQGGKTLKNKNLFLSLSLFPSELNLKSFCGKDKKINF